MVDNVRFLIRVEIEDPNEQDIGPFINLSAASDEWTLPRKFKSWKREERMRRMRLLVNHEFKSKRSSNFMQNGFFPKIIFL